MEIINSMSLIWKSFINEEHTITSVADLAIDRISGCVRERFVIQPLDPDMLRAKETTAADGME